MQGVQLFMFVVALPALVALGHDGYLYFTNPDMGFEFAALGFIWTKYHPDSYKWVVEQTEPLGYWPYINWVLAQSAVAVGAAIAGFFYVILGFLKMAGAWPFGENESKNFTGNRRIDELMGRKKGSGFKYNRK